MSNLKRLKLKSVLFEERAGNKHFFAFPKMEYAAFLGDLKKTYLENIIGSFKACCPDFTRIEIQAEN